MPATGDYSKIQRERLIHGAAEVAAEHGYTKLTTTLIVKAARVSRNTFYVHFSTPEDCFLAAIDEALDQLARVVVAQHQRKGPWQQKLREGVQAVFRHWEAEPALARLLVVETPLAGPFATERRARALEAAQAAVDEGRRFMQSGPSVAPLTAQTLVAGALAVVHERLMVARTPRLTTLLNPIMAVLVQPYLGPAASAAELAQPAPQAAAVRPHTGASPLTLQGPSNGDGASSDLDRFRLTYRTHQVLTAIAENPGACNREVADVGGISDPGQISRLLARLESRGLIQNSADDGRWAPNQWQLTTQGRAVCRGDITLGQAAAWANGTHHNGASAQDPKLSVPPARSSV